MIKTIHSLKPDGNLGSLLCARYGGGYCNFYGGWGRRFDFFTNKRTVAAPES